MMFVQIFDDGQLRSCYCCGDLCFQLPKRQNRFLPAWMETEDGGMIFRGDGRYWCHRHRRLAVCAVKKEDRWLKRRQAKRSPAMAFSNHG
jgi:hypothetical protein